MNTWSALGLGVLLLVVNAFFVAAEFALVASRRHRLEERAAAGSAAARAAVHASRELSLMLAGAQLGITLCTLGLGALAEPALERLLEPLLSALGLPHQAAYVGALVLGVAVVVLLHMVIGEMAPKSWAISHPERSAILVALPFRAFSRATRPLLLLLNNLANALVRFLRVTPRDENSLEVGPAELRLLLTQSHEQGALAVAEHRRLTGALRLEDMTLAARTVRMARVVTIGADAAPDDVERLSRASGRSRLVVLDRGKPVGVVHVRDAVARTTLAKAATTDVRAIMRPLATLPVDLPLIDAVAQLRAERAQLALVRDHSGSILGITAMEDLIEEVLGRFEDETDRLPSATP